MQDPANYCGHSYLIEQAKSCHNNDDTYWDGDERDHFRFFSEKLPYKNKWFHDFWLAPPNKDIDKIGRPPM